MGDPQTHLQNSFKASKSFSALYTQNYLQIFRIKIDISFKSSKSPSRLHQILKVTFKVTLDPQNYLQNYLTQRTFKITSDHQNRVQLYINVYIQDSFKTPQN